LNVSTYIVTPLPEAVDAIVSVFPLCVIVIFDPAERVIPPVRPFTEFTIFGALIFAEKVAPAALKPPFAAKRPLTVIASVMASPRLTFPLATKFPLTVRVEPEGIVVFDDKVAPEALIPLGAFTNPYIVAEVCAVAPMTAVLEPKPTARVPITISLVSASADARAS
jgi:hypothetical protein